VNDERNVTSIGIDVDNNFLDEGADDAFLQAQISLGGLPRNDQVSAERPEVISVWLNRLTDPCPLNARLDLLHRLQSCVPPTFELGDNEAILGVDNVVLFARKPLRVARRLQLQ
jgi:hypothetical protein